MAEYDPKIYAPWRKIAHMATARYFLTPLYWMRNLIEVHGRENIPKNTQLLIVGNHLSNWDPPLLCIATDLPMAYVAKNELFDVPVLKHLIKFYGAIAINRHKPEKSTIKTIKKVLAQGWNLGMFIEGTRSKNPGYLGPPHTGTAYFAYSNNIQILPVGIIGTNEKFKKAKAYIGKPITPSKDFEKTTWEVMEALSELTGYKIMDRKLAEHIE